MSTARNVVWGVVLACATCFAVRVVLGPWLPKANLVIGLVFLFFMGQPIGAFWMLYHCFRYEARPLPFVFIACIPYGFAWYYFERVRGRPAPRLAAEQGPERPQQGSKVAHL
jgi:hypothetical protein